MAGQGYVAVPPDSTGKKVDCVSLSVSGQTAYRQVVTLGSPTSSAGYANVTGGKLEVLANISGSVLAAVTGTVNIGNNVTVQGQVSVTGSVAISNNINVSAMPNVTIGTMPNVNISSMPNVTVGNNINISAMPNVVLAAGSNNIGTINAISAAVTLAAGSNNIGKIDAISAAVAIASLPNVNVSAMPAVNISAMPAVRAYQGPLGLSSASHGPKCVTLSTSAAVTLAPAPGVGQSIFIDQLMFTNGGGNFSRLDVYEASNTAACLVCGFAAATGGGFVMNFDPPIKVSPNTALNARVKPNTSGDSVITINFHVE